MNTEVITISTKNFNIGTRKNTCEMMKEKLISRSVKQSDSLERDYLKLKNTIDSMIASQYIDISAKLFLIIIASIIISMMIGVYITSNHLPTAVRENDLSSENVPRSIGYRAMQDLIELTNFGSKPVGSYENEYLTVTFLKHKLETIQKQAPSRWNSIDIDVQVVSGDFTLLNKAKTFRKQKVYRNIQNVVAKLYSENNTAESILVNCHFDTVFNCPGTSDDGLNCAVMLEVLRVMSKVDYPLKRNVVFLFNGAEEDGVSGSHGFVNNHEWFKEVICVVNLDASGAGGRPQLFQSGPNAYVLPKIYATSVPYPSSKVMSEELYGTGLLPSNTDFSIFRDDGKLNGLDIAHTGNGYVYHTIHDNISAVTEKDVQVTGDNLLALLNALVDYDNLKEDIFNNRNQAVYYDIFGIFVICYTSTTSVLVNLVVIFVSLSTGVFVLHKNFEGKPAKIIVRHVLIDLAFVVIGILAVTLVIYLLATLLKLNGTTMLWYSNQWFALTYYAAAVLLVMFGVLKIRQNCLYSMLSAEQEAKVFVLVIQFIITVTLLFGTLSGFRSSFILIIGLIGVSISHYVMNKTRLRLEKAEGKFISYVAINFLPAVYLAYVFIPAFQTIIPMLGRKGANFDSEVVLGVGIEFVVLLTFAYFIPLVLLVKEHVTMQYAFLAIYILQAFIANIVLSPFSDSAPQRFYLLHVSRKLAHEDVTLKNESSGYLIVPHDIRGGETISKLFKEENFQQLANTNWCEEELFCGMPSLHTSTVLAQPSSFWAPREIPNFSSKKEFKYEVKNDGNDSRIFNINLKGSKFMDVVILPVHGAKLNKWSFDPEIPQGELRWNDQSAYFIRYHEGSLNQSSLSFKVKFNIEEMQNKKDHVFKLAWSVFYPSNSTDDYTPEFNNFSSKFPSNTVFVPMVAAYEEYLLPDLY